MHEAPCMHVRECGTTPNIYTTEYRSYTLWHNYCQVRKSDTMLMFKPIESWRLSVVCDVGLAQHFRTVASHYKSSTYSASYNEAPESSASDNEAPTPSSDYWARIYSALNSWRHWSADDRVPDRGCARPRSRSVDCWPIHAVVVSSMWMKFGPSASYRVYTRFVNCV